MSDHGRTDRQDGRGARALRAGVMLSAALLGAGCATTAGAVRDLPARDCGPGLTGSFVQLSGRELRFDRTAWRDELALLRSMGARTLIIQFTGDEDGPYDGRAAGRTPVRDLVDEASAAGVTTWLGLHAEAPAGRTRALPAPLDDAAESGALAALCRAHESCEGFYLSTEMDDHLGLPDAPRVSAFLARAATALRRLAPEKRLAVAPFFTGALSPRQHAAFWRPFLEAHLVDVFMLQDGVGTRRATPQVARDYLAALRAVMPEDETDPRGPMELWSVVELFDQLTGPPHDDGPFAARAASFSVVARSLRLEGPTADRLIAFSMLDYGDPRRGRREARLYDSYTDWCDQQQQQQQRRSAAPWPAASRFIEAAQGSGGSS